MPLPQRPGPYILTLLVIVLAVLVAWMFQAVNSPEIDRALEQKAKAQAAKPAVTTTPPARPAPVFLDPVLQAQADRLNAPEHTAQEDVQIVAEFVDVYRKALGGNPIGQTTTLPPRSPALVAIRDASFPRTAPPFATASWWTAGAPLIGSTRSPARKWRSALQAPTRTCSPVTMSSISPS